MADIGLVDAKPLTDQVRKAVERNNLALPPLSQVLARLLDLLGDETRANTKEVAQLIRNEPATAAALLRMANSAIFGGLQQISDLSQAIVRLGFRQVTSAVTTLSHSSHFHSRNPAREELLQDLWRHAVATAIASKHLTEMTSGEPEEAFVAGLLHDCGKLLVIKGLEDVTKGNPEPEITPALCGEIMDVLHADLGYRTLVRWHLPQAVCVAAQKHHETDAKDAGPLLLRVQAANAVARKLGHHLKPDPELDLLTLPAVERLSLSDIELASLMVDVDDEVAEVTRLV